MAVTANSYITPQAPNRGVLQFTTASTASTYLTLYTAGANGSKVFGVIGTTSDTATHAASIAVVVGAVKYQFGDVTIPSTAGTVGTVPPVALFSAANTPGLPVDNDGNPYIVLVSGDTLQATFSTALGLAGSVLNIVCMAADY
jgi:hypothetical protein